MGLLRGNTKRLEPCWYCTNRRNVSPMATKKGGKQRGAPNHIRLFPPSSAPEATGLILPHRTSSFWLRWKIFCIKRRLTDVVNQRTIYLYVNLTYITYKIIQLSIWCQYLVFFLCLLYEYFISIHRIFLLLHCIVGITMHSEAPFNELKVSAQTHPPTHPGEPPLCSCFSDLGDFSSSITWGSTCHHLFATAGMTINKLHSLARSLACSLAPPQSKSGSGVWKQWSEFKPSHVFLKRVSGNGNASKIKREKGGRRRREGGERKE